ncbi:hypothetical protein IKG45_01875 [Candidatus Saccharibacteria bacterium]|nr:hypothetical protein [Candidatus Saccharibacteria bacterium]
MGIQITSVNGENLTFVVEGDLSVKDREKVMEICHQYKNMYMEGYPHGRQKRQKLAKAGIIYQKWKEYPGVTICYLPKKLNNGLQITALPSADKGRTETELQLIAQQWQQDVIDAIEAEFNT